MSRAPVLAFAQRITVIAFAVTAGIVACGKGGNGATKDSLTASVNPHSGPTCGPAPTKADSSRLASTGFFSWPTTYIPEYQDDQAFWIIRHGAKPAHYGPLACVVAADNLESLKESDFNAQVLVAIVWVAADVPIVTGDPYSALDLRAGYNCLWFQKSGGAWKGWMIPVGAEGCRPPATGGRPVFQHGGGSSPSDYPAVARFMEGKGDGRIGVGVYCAGNWCGFGLSSAAAVDPFDEPIPGSGLPGHIRRSVLGWHDQQHLALTTSGTMKASVKATIVPEDNLESLTTTANFAGGPLVAQVYFQNGAPALSKYVLDWGFSAVPDFRNTLALRYVGASGSDPANPANWEVRVNGTKRDKLKVHFTSHGAGARIPGTARWRWKANDEEVWVRCLDGCCHVEDY